MSIATARRVRSIRRPARVELRTADMSHASKLHALIEAHREEGHLLPRSLEEIELRAPRFVVAVQGDSIVGCAELAPLSSVVAEVRSLVVAPSVRGVGVGTMLVDELRRRGRAAGFDRLCAFTHSPGYFMQFGFSLVPHAWLGEKIAADCSTCALFRKCGQYAMVVSLSESHQTAARSTAIPVALLRRA